MVTTVSIDITHTNNPVDCIEIDLSGNSFYIVWDQLSALDKEIMEQVETDIGVTPLPWASLDAYILPNGMTFTSTYKFLMKPHPGKPSWPMYDYEQVYYDNTSSPGTWKRLADDTAVP